MAAATVNKSEAIRDYLKSVKPSERSPKAVAEALKAKGLTVTPGFVGVVKSHMKNGRKTQKVKRKAIKPKAKAKARKATRSVSNFGSLITASNFINSAGGLKQAKALLDVVSQLRS